MPSGANLYRRQLRIRAPAAVWRMTDSEVDGRLVRSPASHFPSSPLSSSSSFVRVTCQPVTELLLVVVPGTSARDRSANTGGGRGEVGGGGHGDDFAQTTTASYRQIQSDTLSEPGLPPPNTRTHTHKHQPSHDTPDKHESSVFIRERNRVGKGGVGGVIQQRWGENELFYVWRNKQESAGGACLCFTTVGVKGPSRLWLSQTDRHSFCHSAFLSLSQCMCVCACVRATMEVQGRATVRPGTLMAKQVSRDLWLKLLHISYE